MPIERIIRPFQRFAQIEASGGILLLVCTVVALGLANSPLHGAYHHFWETTLTIGFGGHALSYSLHHWINDGLMAIFFFVVGLEIKREILAGELRSPRQAMLPILAALGGMVVPAGIYAACNWGGAIHGWGIPMATDIAFALGVLALLGKRVPLPLKVFLTALAIVDDLGAVLVIAVFYTSQLSWVALGIGGAILAAMIALNLGGVRKTTAYWLLGVALWLAFLKSGVHATIAGVLAALTIPARVKLRPEEFGASITAYLEGFAGKGGASEPLLSHTQQRHLSSIEALCEDVESPMQRLEHRLHGWVMFAIMPIFALANAGVSLGGGGEMPEGSAPGGLFNSVGVGVMLGLFLGKQIGITLFSWLAVRLGLASLPPGVTWRHIYGAALLGGIGFTMSLFVTALAFTDPGHVLSAKLAILAASAASGVAGFLLLVSGPPVDVSESVVGDGH